MSELFTFIATKTTYQTVVPSSTSSQEDFNRKVRLAIEANAGGVTQVGNLLFRPKSDAVPNHLLCDGSEKEKADFPQLADYLGDSQGVATASTRFVLPNFIDNPLTTATEAPEQVAEGGTVSTGGTVTTPTQPGQTGGTQGGNIPSGARYRFGPFGLNFINLP